MHDTLVGWEIGKTISRLDELIPCCYSLSSPSFAALLVLTAGKWEDEGKGFIGRGLY